MEKYGFVLVFAGECHNDKRILTSSLHLLKQHGLQKNMIVNYEETILMEFE